MREPKYDLQGEPTRVLRRWAVRGRRWRWRYRGPASSTLAAVPTVSSPTATHDRTRTEPSARERPLLYPFVFRGGSVLPGNSPKLY